MTNISEREVRTVEREGRAAKVVVLRRRYAAGTDEVWDALTDPDRIPRWFLPVHGDLAVGGRFQFEGQAGGLVEACERPERFAITWEYGGEISWVTVRLLGASDETVVELEHTAYVDTERWDQFGPGAVGVGWDLGLLGLGWHLDTGSSATAEEGAAWSVSEEGLAFTRECSAGWGEASVADGTDPQAARAAAERTTAFYTGQPA